MSYARKNMKNVAGSIIGVIVLRDRVCGFYLFVTSRTRAEPVT